MPLCAVISSRLLCMHGGISPEIANWDSLVILQKPKTPRACDEGLAVDLMWSDPSSDPCTGFQFNTTRATSYIFGGDTILKLCELLDIALVVRAHEVVKVMKVSRRLELSFVTLKPRLDTTRLTEERRALLEKMMNDANAKSPDPCARQSKNNTQSSDSNTDTSCLVGPGVEIPTVPEATQPSPPPPPPKPAAPPPPPPPKPAAPPSPPPKPAAPPPKSAAPPPPPKPVAPPPPPKQPTPTPPESSILDADDQRKSDLLALVGVPVPTPKRASPTPTRMATSRTIISPKPAIGAPVPFQRRRDPTPAPTMATQQSSTVKLPPRQPSSAPAAKPNELDSTPRSSSLMSTTKTAQGSPSTARSLRSSPKPVFAPKTSAPKAASPPQRPHAGKGLSVVKKSPYELSELSDSDLSISEKKVSAPQKQQQPKPRSVEEAAKQAMTASKAPPQPNSRNQSEIIDATQKALTKPNREQQQK